MLSMFLGWVLKSKAVKVGAGALSGTGVLALIFNLHTDVTQKIEKQDVAHKEYVQMSIEPVQRDINNLVKEAAETKSLIRDIHHYLLKSKNK